MLAKLDHKVLRLKRVAIGPVDTATVPILTRMVKP